LSEVDRYANENNTTLLFGLVLEKGLLLLLLRGFFFV